MQTTNISSNSTLPITRALVLQSLGEGPLDADRPDCYTTEPITISPVKVDDSSLLQDSQLELADIRAWLDEECVEYREFIASIIKRDTEHRCKAIQAQIASTFEPGLNDRYGQLHDSSESLGLDTSILDRIRAGDGPRSPRFTDLLAPLRLPETSRPCQTKQPEEDYQELRNVLLAWNKHVATTNIDNNNQARDALFEALASRIADLTSSISRRRSADALGPSSRKLLHTIHIYRPETADFQTQDPIALLTIILAHVGFANPDVDDEMKYFMFHTLVAEHQHTLLIANDVQRREYEIELASAQLLKLPARFQAVAKSRDEWLVRMIRRSGDAVLTSVKTTRRRIYHSVLGELLPLAIWHAAQKSVLHEHAYPVILDTKRNNLSILPNLCDLASSNLVELATSHLDVIESTLSSLTHLLADTSKINNARVLTRAVKFAGRDLKHVSEQDRVRIVRQRMEMPATAIMMSDAVAGMKETGEAVGRMCEGLNDVGRRLEVVRRAVEEERRVFEEFLGVVEE